MAYVDKALSGLILPHLSFQENLHDVYHHMRNQPAGDANRENMGAYPLSGRVSVNEGACVRLFRYP